MSNVYDYRIGAGHNVALASLVRIHSIRPTGDTHYFYDPIAIGNFDPGNPNVRGDGLLAFNGFPSVAWLFPVMTRIQLAYARSTWCNGGWSGFVTIYSTNGDTTYARYNANLLLSLPSQFDGTYFANKNVRMVMTQLVAL